MRGEDRHVSGIIPTTIKILWILFWNVPLVQVGTWYMWSSVKLLQIMVVCSVDIDVYDVEDNPIYDCLIIDDVMACKNVFALASPSEVKDTLFVQFAPMLFLPFCVFYSVLRTVVLSRMWMDEWTTHYDSIDSLSRSSVFLTGGEAGEGVDVAVIETKTSETTPRDYTVLRLQTDCTRRYS